MKLPFGRGAHRHVKVKREPLVANPAKSITLKERLASPWLVIGQYVFNIVMVAMVLWLTGNDAEFQRTQVEYSQYLDGKGVQRDAERDAAERERAEEREQSRLVLCELIAALEADIGGELQRISNVAGCAANQGPIQPGAGTEMAPDGTLVPSPSGPIEDGGGTSTGSVTPGSQSTTGTAQGAPRGRESSPPPATAPVTPGAPGTPEPARPTPAPPAEEEEAGDAGGLVYGIDLCAPLLGCLL